jgi:AAA15 family ATPase/GTPase
MRIKSITIENFKAFPKVKIECNENFNYIVGENNIGKSTILEAIQLWKIGYDTIIQNNGNSFYGQNTPRYLPFESLFFLRLSVINDIFNNKAKKKVSITLDFQHEGVEYSLKITLEKPGSIDTYFRVKFSSVAFGRFKEKVIELGLNLTNVIFLYQTRPIFHSIKNEPFYNNAQLMKKISLGKSSEVIRNKILKIEHAEDKFFALEQRLNRVFKSNIKFRYKNTNKQDDEFIKITFQEGTKKEVDISLIGSGLLQVIEIFSTLEFINQREHCLNILLIDEPDSHLHANLQSNLIDELRLDLSNQVFLVSHNERLINKAEDGELFYVNRHAIANGLIQNLPHDCYDTVAIELAGELLELSLEEKTKIIIITEGKTDKKILDKAWEKLNPGIESPFHFVSSGLELEEEKREGCADTVKRTIELASTVMKDVRLVGLFHNDQEGNAELKGLNKKIFNPYSLDNISRNHKTKMVFGLCLPIPDSRIEFVTIDDLTQRYLVIEHFFSDEVLLMHSMKGKNILTSNVFRIQGDKNKFANKLDELEAVEFENFKLIFETIQNLFADVLIEVEVI